MAVLKIVPIIAQQHDLCVCAIKLIKGCPLLTNHMYMIKTLIMQEHYTVYNGFLIALGPDLYDPILRLQKEIPWMLGMAALVSVIVFPSCCHWSG